MPTIIERFEATDREIKPVSVWRELENRSMFILIGDIYSGDQISSSVIDKIESMLPGNSLFFILKGHEYLHPAGLELIPVETIRETIKNDMACIFRRQLYINRRINELGYVLLCASLGKDADGEDVAAGIVYADSRIQSGIDEDHLFGLLGNLRRNYDAFCHSKSVVGFARDTSVFRYVIDPADGKIIMKRMPHGFDNSRAVDALNQQVTDQLIPSLVTADETPRSDYLVKRRFKNLKISRIKSLDSEYILVSFKPTSDFLLSGENYEELINSFSHKLKGKLSAIHTAASQLATQEGSVIDKDDAALLTIIESAVEGADNLVTRLNKYLGSNSNAVEQVDLHKIIEEAIKEEISGRESEPCTAMALNASNPYVKGDTRQLKKAVEEIVANAFEACPPSGEIFIETSRDEENISIVARNNLSSSIRYDSPKSVSDYKRPFISCKPKHAGMGLSIVRRIIDDHGGEVIIDKCSDATFKVTLSLPINDKAGEKS